MTFRFFAGYDCARSGDLEVILTNTGGGGATGTATLTGRYMPGTMDCSDVDRIDSTGEIDIVNVGYSEACAALKEKLDAIGTTFTVTFSLTTRKYTITQAGTGGVTAMQLEFNAAAKGFFGFTGIKSGALTYTSDVCAYYVIEGSLGGVTAHRRPYETIESLATDIVSNDGIPEGMAHPRATQMVEATVPFEPKERVWFRDMSSSDPWTWELAFAHCRNIEPIVLSGIDPDEDWVCKLTAESCAFDPELASDEYFAVASIKIAAYYIGVTEGGGGGGGI